MVSNITELKFKIASPQELELINKKEAEFHRGCGLALQWIYNQQNWKGFSISNRISGMSASTWEQYGQPGYSKVRSLHAVACFMWLSQLSMSALYYGSNVGKLWPGMGGHSIKTLTYTSLLNTKQFETLVSVYLDKMNALGLLIPADLSENMIALSNHNDESFIIPDGISLDEFKSDYYQSVAKKLFEFRSRCDISLSCMADVLGVTIRRYRGYENPSQNTTIPIHLGWRLKLGFHLVDTTELLGDMKVYHGFRRARQIQQLRENVIFSLFSVLSASQAKMFEDMAQSFMVFNAKDAA